MFDFQSFPHLETDRLVLRETTEGDAPALFELYRDPEMSKYITFSTHADIEQTKGFIAWMADVFAKKDSIRWGFELKAANRLIGTGGLHFWKRDVRCAEVGYHIGRAYWGSGYATEALRVLVDFGFERMNLNRIEGCHNAGNDASGRVMEKAGFRREGTWRQRVLKDGVLVDSVQYSLLRSEYLER
jgi:ribosomal-protein-alanine N-acetyltransferase